MTHKLILITKITAKSKQLGFTLIEIAVSLIIIGLLLGGLVIPLSDSFRGAQTRSSLERMAAVKEALIGYVVRNQRFPCPALEIFDSADKSLEGKDSCSGSAGSAYSTAGVLRGFIPWKDLGVQFLDSWGNGIFYAVERRLTNKEQFLNLMINNESINRIKVSSRSDFDLTTEITLAENVAVVIGSFGRNAEAGRVVNFQAHTGELFGTDSGNITIPSGITGDEETNILSCCKSMPSSNFNNSVTFYSRGEIDKVADDDIGAFDDKLIWIPFYQIVGIMTEASRLQ